MCMYINNIEYVCILYIYIYISQCIYYSDYLIPLPSIWQDIENIIDNSPRTNFLYKLNPSLIGYLNRCYRLLLLYV